jgi:hypothetical protein
MTADAARSDPLELWKVWQGRRGTLGNPAGLEAWRMDGEGYRPATRGGGAAKRSP